MNIQILRNEKQTVGDFNYHYIGITDLDTSKAVVVHKAVSSKSGYEYVNVHVINAMSKAYRGLGKNFANKAEALAAYKDPFILHAINLIEEKPILKDVLDNMLVELKSLNKMRMGDELKHTDRIITEMSEVLDVYHAELPKEDRQLCIKTIVQLKQNRNYLRQRIQIILSNFSLN